MSAAAARRRKQLAAKAAAAGEDPITTKLNSLLAADDLSESTAYEALQLAQSQVRKSVIAGNYSKATETYAYDVLVKLLEKGKASVASQLMSLLVQVLNETHTACNGAWVKRIQNLSELNLKAVKGIQSVNETEYRRLMKLHAKFLKSALGWSNSLGLIRFGSLEIHKLLADQLWEMSVSQAENTTSSEEQEEAEEEAGAEDYSSVGLQSEAVTHYSLAEDVEAILAKLATLPGPTDEETAQNHPCPPCARESLLTRSILLLLSVENIRDAYKLLTSYLETIESRDIEELKKSYMSKTDGKSPSHPVFLSMLLQICRKNAKTGPLFSWAIKGFNAELSKMYKPDVLKMYTNNIGKVYFNILPPPSMMSTIENMMNMMNGAGGLGGPGGINPAMMQAMMQGGM
mmetsp:Transcript_12154/g.15420  ORF Transcript_12154/g.15420 Transcript_12154/m.15420 type:complete len:402 (+) Transcript_12154:132-1337(+)|eukprot:CAMPEP_0203663342 /NCGR_PEP_ID=MMETSP0090-20130426/952_1 /ASSEMBLY_ACC=CAM_ASM_001088 /TAXON_ID=426623 /ORGANISM="Chaetoceros affinis, Strain CCMP159" /LENGTH=401 /DNA_ID=CAMNT_0050526229 /DNA_START=105 /DNA_END=1310 /DNA_ORIENTATION=+